MKWTRKTFPEQKVGLICRKGLGQAFLELGLIDFYWEIEKGKRDSYQKVIGDLKNFDVNNWISPHTSVRTALMTAQVKAKNKISFKRFWNFIFFNTRIEHLKKYPEAIRLLDLIKYLNSDLQKHFNELPQADLFIQKNSNSELLSPPSWSDPGNCIDPEVLLKKKEQYQIDKKMNFKNAVAIFPGSVWATKMWKKEKFIELGKSIQGSGFQVIIMGGREEVSLGTEIASQISGAIQLCGKTSVLESLLILSQVKLVIGNDSSSSHMAALMNKPVVSFFGPTVLRFGYRPWTQKVKVFEVENLKCRPCGAHGPQVCPLGHHKCMQDLDVTYQDVKSFFN